MINFKYNFYKWLKKSKREKKMRRKIKLISTFASLMLVFVIMAYSVWAAQQVNVSITNSVSYTVVGNVCATISATKAAGANTSLVTPPADPTPINLLGNETATTGTLNIGNIVLDADSTLAGQTIKFSYTITIQNNATTGIAYDRLTVTFDAPDEVEYEPLGFGITVAYGGTVTDPSDEVILDPGQTVTMTVTFTGDAQVSHDTSLSGELNSSVMLVATEKA